MAQNKAQNKQNASGSNAAMSKDAKFAKLEGELEKLKKKKAVLQLHIKSASEIQSTEIVCKTIIDMVHQRQSDDLLLNNGNNNPYTMPIAQKPCCSSS